MSVRAVPYAALLLGNKRAIRQAGMLRRFKLKISSAEEAEAFIFLVHLRPLELFLGNFGRTGTDFTPNSMANRETRQPPAAWLRTVLLIVVLPHTPAQLAAASPPYPARMPAPLPAHFHGCFAARGSGSAREPPAAPPSTPAAGAGPGVTVGCLVLGNNPPPTAWAPCESSTTTAFVFGTAQTGAKEMLGRTETEGECEALVKSTRPAANGAMWGAVGFGHSATGDSKCYAVVKGKDVRPKKCNTTTVTTSTQTSTTVTATTNSTNTPGGDDCVDDGDKQTCTDQPWRTCLFTAAASTMQGEVVRTHFRGNASALAAAVGEAEKGCLARASRLDAAYFALSYAALPPPRPSPPTPPQPPKPGRRSSSCLPRWTCRGPVLGGAHSYAVYRVPRCSNTTGAPRGGANGNTAGPGQAAPHEAACASWCNQSSSPAGCGIVGARGALEGQPHICDCAGCGGCPPRAGDVYRLASAGAKNCTGVGVGVGGAGAPRYTAAPREDCTRHVGAALLPGGEVPDRGGLHDLAEWGGPEGCSVPAAPVPAAPNPYLPHYRAPENTTETTTETTSDDYRRVCKLAAAPHGATTRVRVRRESVDTRRAPAGSGRVLHSVPEGGCIANTAPCKIRWCDKFDRHDKWVGTGGSHGVVEDSLADWLARKDGGCKRLTGLMSTAGWEVWRNQVTTRGAVEYRQPNGCVPLVLPGSPYGASLCGPARGPAHWVRRSEQTRGKRC